MIQLHIKALTFLAVFFLQQPSQCSDLAIVDFLDNPTKTERTYSNNYVGMVMEYKQIEHLINNTVFQGYMRVTHTNGNWMNMIFSSLRLPYDWNYNCGVTAPNSSNVTRNTYCQRDLLQANDTLLNQTIYYVLNSQPQPFWTFSFERPNNNVSTAAIRNGYGNLLITKLLQSTGEYYDLELGYAVNKYAQKEWRNSSTFGPDVFKTELTNWYRLIGGLTVKAPGLTEDASGTWLNVLPTLFSNYPYGVFTFEGIVFNSSNASSSLEISDLLDSENIKNYLKKKTYVNSTFSYPNFVNIAVAFSSLRLTSGDGKNGVTNSFAAGLWWIQFVVESCVFGVYDIGMDGRFEDGYYQSMWEVMGNGSYRPSVFYYATNFVNLAGEKYANVSYPDVNGDGKIKVYGFETLLTQKYLILNKNVDQSKSGEVVIKTRGSSTTYLKCISFKAPSLSSTSGFTIAGHYYDYGKAEPQGPYEESEYEYNETGRYYRVKIGYAQALLCDIPNPNMIIPTGKSWENTIILSVLGLIVLFSL